MESGGAARAAVRLALGVALLLGGGSAGADETIAQFLHSVPLCFLTDAPATVPLGTLGDLEVGQICCRNTAIDGLNLTCGTLSEGEALAWGGASTFDFTVGSMAT